MDKKKERIFGFEEFLVVAGYFAASVGIYLKYGLADTLCISGCAALVAGLCVGYVRSRG